MSFWERMKKTGAVFTIVTTVVSMTSILYGYHKVFILNDVHAAISKEFVKKDEIESIVQKIDLTRGDLSEFRKEVHGNFKEIRSYLMERK